MSLLDAQLLAERYALPTPPTDRAAQQAHRRRELAEEPEPTRAPCPECPATDLVVRSGRYAGQLPAHTPGHRSHHPGQERCPGSGRPATTETRNP